jgi:intracellular sulfur oxidation DsrE/DsrF family protein
LPRGQKVELTDLLPGFVRVDQLGVTRLAELQADAYAYLRSWVLVVLPL